MSTNVCIGCMVAVFLMALALGCGSGPPREARMVLHVTARALQSVDAVAEPRYEAASNAAIESIASADPPFAGPLAEYHRRMAEWDALHDAVAFARGAQLALDRGIQAWEEGARDVRFNWQRSVTCVAAAMGAVVQSMQRLGIDLPSAVVEALGLLGRYGGQLCDSLQTHDVSRKGE